MNTDGKRGRNRLSSSVFICAPSVACLLLFAATTFAQSKPSTRPGGEVVPPVRRDVPGKRIKLVTGELFVPDFFRAGEIDDRADVVVWFLGAPWCAQQVFYDARKDAV